MLAANVQYIKITPAPAIDLKRLYATFQHYLAFVGHATVNLVRTVQSCLNAAGNWNIYWMVWKPQKLQLPRWQHLLWPRACKFTKGSQNQCILVESLKQQILMSQYLSQWIYCPTATKVQWIVVVACGGHLNWETFQKSSRWLTFNLQVFKYVFLNVHPCFGVALLKSIIYIYIVAFWMRRDKQCIMVTLHCVFVSEYLGLCHWQNGAWHVWPNRFAGERVVRESWVKLYSDLTRPIYPPKCSFSEGKSPDLRES